MRKAVVHLPSLRSLPVPLLFLLPSARGPARRHVPAACSIILSFPYLRRPQFVTDKASNVRPGVPRLAPYRDTFLSLPFHTSSRRRYPHIDHLLLFPGSLSTREFIRNNPMRLVDHTIDQSVAAGYLCLNFSSCVELIKSADEVRIRCARFAATSGTP